jgi:hypothetical protein
MAEILEVIEKKISYSGMSMLRKCRRKAYLRYKLRVERDADLEDDALALRFGSAFHKVCELTQHEKTRYTQQILNECCKAESLEYEEVAKVYACLMSYYRLHTASRLRCIGLEMEVSNEFILGYIDAILVDTNGFWWICDLKTSGMIMESLFARLHRDPQLNLYANFAGQVAQKFNLDTSKFSGVRYRVVSKPRSAPKIGESLDAYSLRAAPEMYDVEVNAAELDYVEAFEDLMQAKQELDSLSLETAQCNRSACLEYNRPCEYWSQCHGKTYTECKESVRVFTLKNIVDRTRSITGESK